MGPYSSVGSTTRSASNSAADPRESNFDQPTDPTIEPIEEENDPLSDAFNDVENEEEDSNSNNSHDIDDDDDDNEVILAPPGPRGGGKRHKGNSNKKKKSCWKKCRRRYRRSKKAYNKWRERCEERACCRGFRRFQFLCRKYVTTTALFRYFILLCIGANCIFIAMEDPTTDETTEFSGYTVFPMYFCVDF